MTATFKYLTTNNLSLESIWAWARQLVKDLNSFASSSVGTPVGTVEMFAGASVPDGWILCDGAEYTKAAYPALFLAIGYTYGGAGDVFNVPDCRDRLLIGAGTLAALGAAAGAATATIGIDNLPAHNHGVTDPGHTHVFTADPHAHAVTDTGHVHTINDPTHSHAGGAAAAGLTGAAGGASDVTAQAATSAASTGITLNSATTGVTLNNTTVTGANASSTTGITTTNTGGGAAISLLNPVLGMNMIIKA